MKADYNRVSQSNADGGGEKNSLKVQEEKGKKFSTKKMASVPFDTVATFNDKKNNNHVSVNIALQPLKHVPQPPHLRVDKATITDPEAAGQEGQQKQQKQKSRLHSVLDSLKSVFQWTTHSISGGMRNSESFIVDNGEQRCRRVISQKSQFQIWRVFDKICLRLTSIRTIYYGKAFNLGYKRPLRNDRYHTFVTFVINKANFFGRTWQEGWLK